MLINQIFKTCLAILIMSSHVMSQNYTSVIQELESEEDPALQLEILDKAIALPSFQDHPDTLAMFHYKKSGVLFRGSVSIAESIAALDKALSLIDEDKDRDLWIKLWYYKGFRYRKWDKYEEAKQALTQVLKYKEDNLYIWDATIQLGKTYKDRGEFSVALDTYDHAITLAGEDKYMLATTYEVISFVYLIMETKEGARSSIPWLIKLIDLLKTMEDEESFIASIHYNVGTAYLTLEEYKEAEKWFDKSEEILDACCIDKDLKSLLYEVRANLMLEEGRYDEAIANYKKGIELYQHSFDLTRSDGLSSSYHLIASAYDQKGDLTNALSYISKALSYRLAGIDSGKEKADISIAALQENGEKHYLIDELIYKSQILLALAEKKGDASFDQEALKILSYADIVVDFMRFEHLEETTKVFWRSMTAEVYQLLVSTNYKLGNNKEAFKYAEKSKYLVMGEHLVQQDTTTSLSGLSDDLKSAYADIQRGIQRDKLQIKNLERSESQVGLDSIKSNLLALRKAEDDLMSEIKSDHPAYFKENFGFEIATVDQIRSSLIGDEQSLLEFFVDDDDLYLFVISQEDFIVKKVPIENNLIDTFEKLKNAITHPARTEEKYLKQYAQAAYSIYSLCIAPIKDDLKKSVLIVSDDVLTLVPLSILLTDEINFNQPYNRLGDWPFLKNNLSISYLKSASIGLFQAIQQDQTIFDNAVLAFNPSFTSVSTIEDESGDIERSGFSQLSGTAEELAFVKDQMQGSFFEEAEATETNFKNALTESYAICHIATHAIVDDEQPEYSKLVFGTSEEGKDDGYLYAYEITNLPIKSDLVILSACNTGYGKIQKGEGINSIGKSFARAGSHNLVMSLWPVSDQATSSLIKEYYKHLIAGQSKRSSISMAQESFLSVVPAAYHHPYYWGGFVYYGDDKPLMVASASVGSNYTWWIGGLLSLALLFWLRSSKTTKPT